MHLRQLIATATADLSPLGLGTRDSGLREKEMEKRKRPRGPVNTNKSIINLRLRVFSGLAEVSPGFFVPEIGEILQIPLPFAGISWSDHFEESLRDPLVAGQRHWMAPLEVISSQRSLESHRLRHYCQLEGSRFGCEREGLREVRRMHWSLMRSEPASSFGSRLEGIQGNLVGPEWIIMMIVGLHLNRAHPS